MINASRPTSTDTQPDPQQDRTAKPMPQRIASIFIIVQALAAYGRHLSGLLSNPTIWRGFTTIARFFGTIDIHQITARIQRGLMRAAALEALLIQRAQHGRDLAMLAPTTTSTRKAAEPQGESPEPKPRERAQTPESFPSQKQIEAEVRRRPIGRTIAAICLDLGVAPTLCAGPFWDRLFYAILDYRGSLGAVMGEFHRRKEQFDQEDWKRAKLPWPDRTREGAWQALGFFIGENLLDPFQPAPAATAGPS